MSHTPAPWKPDNAAFAASEPASNGWIDGPDGQPVCEYSGCGSHSALWNNREDYRLTLAAPDLLDALKSAWKAMNYMGDQLNAMDCLTKADERIFPIFDEVRDVIAKATNQPAPVAAAPPLRSPGER